MCSITAYIAVEDDRNLRDIWAAHVYAIRMGNLQLEQLAFGSLPNAILDALKAEGHVFEHGSGIDHSPPDADVNRAQPYLYENCEHRCEGDRLDLRCLRCAAKDIAVLEIEDEQPINERPIRRVCKRVFKRTQFTKYAPFNLGHGSSPLRRVFSYNEKGAVVEITYDKGQVNSETPQMDEWIDEMDERMDEMDEDVAPFQRCLFCEDPHIPSAGLEHHHSECFMNERMEGRTRCPFCGHPLEDLSQDEFLDHVERCHYLSDCL